MAFQLLQITQTLAIAQACIKAIHTTVSVKGIYCIVPKGMGWLIWGGGGGSHTLKEAVHNLEVAETREEFAAAFIQKNTQSAEYFLFLFFFLFVLKYHLHRKAKQSLHTVITFLLGLILS